jgi:hypothetical protein
MGVKIPQGLRCYEKSGVDFIGCYPFLELRVDENKYPEPIGH